MRLYLLEIIRRHRRYRGPEAGHSLGDIILRSLLELLRILLFVLEVGEMEAVHAVRVQLQEAWSDNAILKVYNLPTNVTSPLQDLARVLRNDHVIIDEFAVDALAAVGEGGEKACTHGWRLRRSW